MPFQKGHKLGGSRKGKPNKATRDVREAIALIAQRNIDNVEQWLKDVDDPAKRVGLFLDMCEYHIPKLARTELTGKDGEALNLTFSSADQKL